MHYVSFVGMFRSDLFDGLCVIHAPRLYPICGKWFSTTDTRLTQYCVGLAPGERVGAHLRTDRRKARQGRAQRKFVDDHLFKAIDTRCMNTITQNLNRGTLDERTATVMKRLAKNKTERAIFDNEYARDSYEKEMEQTKQ